MKQLFDIWDPLVIQVSSPARQPETSEGCQLDSVQQQLLHIASQRELASDRYFYRRADRTLHRLSGTDCLREFATVPLRSPDDRRRLFSGCVFVDESLRLEESQQFALKASNAASGSVPLPFSR
jgi:hypothetical protein